MERSKALSEIAIADIVAKNSVVCGTDSFSVKNALLNKNKIIKVLKATEKDWGNFRWQINNRIKDIETLLEIFPELEKECENIIKVSKIFRYGITPYYLSLINVANPNCPIKAQCIPNIAELNPWGTLDPMSEEFTNPAGSITRRYPNKLIINSTNACPTLCRHCQRRRLHGEEDIETSKSKLEQSLKYIKNSPEIREVLITGGDALCLDNIKLENIFYELSKIKHIEILRIGTRALATWPQRIDKKLVEILHKYNVFVATQFNHAVELTPEAINAANQLSNNGIQVRNQMVLLKGINDNKYVIQKTNEEMVKAKIIPYYLFHPKKVKGTSHFYVNIDTGLEIMKHLEGHTSGMCKPTYIVNSSKGFGKVPLIPSKNLIKTANGYKVTTWEDKEIIVE